MTPLPNIPKTELDIWRRVAEGQSTKDIALARGTSVKTVDNQRCGLMARIGVHNVAQLTRAAVAYGVVPPAYEIPGKAA